MTFLQEKFKADVTNDDFETMATDTSKYSIEEGELQKIDKNTVHCGVIQCGICRLALVVIMKARVRSNVLMRL